MKMKEFTRKVFWVLLMGLFLWSSEIGTYAHPIELGAQPMTRSYSLAQDVDMNGVTSRYAWYFNTDANWSVKKVTLRLDYSLSELILPKASSMTLYLNDHPFKSFLLQPKHLNELQNITVDVPLKSLRAGSNTLTMRGTARLTEDLCCDENSVGNWIRLHQTSKIQLTYESNKDSALISSYPAPFGGLCGDAQDPTNILIENPKDVEQLGAAMTLMAMLGGQTENPTKQLKLLAYSDYDVKSTEPKIYLGTMAGLPASIKAQFPSTKIGTWQDPKGFVNVVADLDDGGVLLAKLKDATSKNTTLLILTKDSKDWILGVKALSNPNILQQINQQQVVIKKGEKLEVENADATDQIELSDLGMAGIKFTGPYRQSASFGLNMAGKQISKLGSKMVLHFRYSENLDFNTSLMSVYINDIPIGSKRLTLKGASADTLEVSLPKEVKSLSYAEVKLTFDLQITRNLCDLKPIEMPWAYITPDSYLDLPTAPKKITLFQDLPAPFVSDQNLAGIELVVPDQLSKNDLDALGKLFAWMGTGVKGNLHDVKVTPSKLWTLPTQSSNRHVIIYDKMARGSAVGKINDDLWFKSDTGFSQVLSNEKIQLLPEYQKYAGFIELKNMPQWQDKKLLVIYSFDEMQLPQTLAHLYNDSKRSKLNGDAAVVGLNDRSMSFRFQKEVAEKETFKWAEVKQETLQMGIFLGLILLFFVVGISITLYRNRQDRK